jgi:hypothetical protein
VGTFHHDKGELHGITVVVDTAGPEVWIGRCDTVRPDGIVLLDADVHEETADGPTKDEYVRRAAKVGTWKKHDRVVVPTDRIVSIRRLGALRG